MHTTKGPQGTTLIHHGDFSGLVIFDANLEEGHDKKATVAVPMEDLVSLVAEMVRRRRQADIDSTTDRKLLGL